MLNTYTYLETPIGRLLLAGSARALRMIRFPPGSMADAPAREGKLADYFGDDRHAPEFDSWEPAERHRTRAGQPVMKAARQLAEYFDGSRRIFYLALEPGGVSVTPFRKKVWAALALIPYGETRSYQDVAAEVGRPKAPIAIGGANAVNPLPIVVPCHRVIGKDGSLTGFGGGLCRKRYLLDSERR